MGEGKPMKDENSAWAKKQKSEDQGGRGKERIMIGGSLLRDDRKKNERGEKKGPRESHGTARKGKPE